MAVFDRVKPNLVEVAALSNVIAEYESFKDKKKVQCQRATSPCVENLLQRLTEDYRFPRLQSRVYQMDGKASNAAAEASRPDVSIVKMALANVCMVEWKHVQKLAEAYKSQCSGEYDSLRSIVSQFRKKELEISIWIS